MNFKEIDFYTIGDYIQIVSEIFTKTLQCREKENTDTLYNLVFNMFEELEKDKFISDETLKGIKTPDNTTIFISKRLYESHKMIRDYLIKNEIIVSEFNKTDKHFDRYKKDYFENLFYHYQKSSKYSIASRYEDNPTLEF